VKLFIYLQGGEGNRLNLDEADLSDKDRYSENKINHQFQHVCKEWEGYAGVRGILDNVTVTYEIVVRIRIYRIIEFTELELHERN